MGCRFDNEAAWRRAKGLLAKEVVVEYDGHLATCRTCAERFAVADATVGALKVSERGRTPEVDWGRVYRASKSAFVEGHARAIEGPRINLRIWLPSAAAVAAGLALVVWVSSSNDVPKPRGESAVARDESRERERMSERAARVEERLAVVTPSTKDPGAVVTPSTARGGGLRIARGRWSVTSAERGSVEGRAGAAVAIGERIATGRDGSASVTFGETSRVEIAASSTVAPVKDAEGETVLRLHRGKLTAHIAPKGADGKFAVLAGEWRVEVTGTVFLVQLRGSSVRVETMEGAVKVTGPGLDAPRVVSAGESFDGAVREGPKRAIREGVEPKAATGSRVESREVPRADWRREDVRRPRVERPASRELRREVEEFRRAGEELLREYDR